MAELDIRDIEGVVSGITVTAAVVIKRGNLIGLTSGAAVLADADAATFIYARYVALEDGDGNDTRHNKISACTRCTIYDSDAPFTAQTRQYVSGTAGALTETRPATDGDLKQTAGWSIDTYTVRLEIEKPHEFQMWFCSDTYDTTGEPGLGLVDTIWAGPVMDGAGEDTYIKGFFPETMVSLDDAMILFNSIAATAIDLDLTIGGGYVGADNNQDTGAAQTTQGFDGTAADNKLCFITINGASHLMDAGFALPGRLWTVSLDMDGITGGTAMVLGVLIRGLCF